MKKLLSLLLALVFILSCVLIIPSCKNDGDGGGDTPAVDTTPTEIIKNGEALYSIVYPDNCSDVLYSALVELMSAVQLTTGIRLNYLKDSDAIEEDGKYILLGATCFEESATSIDSLKNNEDAHTIEKAGDHIVFAGHFDGAVAFAVEYFCENLLAKNYDTATKTLTLEEYWFDGSYALPATFDIKNLRHYTIVYDARVPGLLEVSNAISARIENMTGVTLTVAKDTGTEESAYEILVGETNRYLSTKCYKDETRLMEYKAVVAKGQLQIVCGGPFSARKAGFALADAMLVDSSFSLETGTHMETVLATESPALTEGADIRVMSANVLAEGTSNKEILPSVERAEILAGILVSYAPDFVGCQELDKNFHDPLDRYFRIIKETYGMEYALITEMNGGKVNQNPIIYRADKFKVDYQAFNTMSYAPNAPSGQYGSGMGNAKFTSLEDSTLEIAIISAHWHWEKEADVVGLPKQYYDAVEMAALVKEYKENYPGVNVFCTGDFNSHRFTRQYLNQFVNSIGGAIASTIAKNNGVLTPSFQHMGQYIDHIIGTSGAFNVLKHAGTNNYSGDLTDHQPIYADIELTNK